ncbi:MAG: twin-arginine translocation signal domain-containing protein, partial [Verrucomicrobiaceae bacterium]
MSEPDSQSFQTRRSFLGNAGAVIAGGAVSMHQVLSTTVQAHGPDGDRDHGRYDDQKDADRRGAPSDPGTLSGVHRANHAYELRLEAARRERSVPIPPHPDNGDEDRYRKRIGSYSKGLKHNARGEVEPDAYNAFLKAIRSGRFQDFERLRPFLGCSDPASQRLFVNPE